MKLGIIESACIDDVAAAQTTLKRMQSIGIGWSIDDFGTGYSSLSLPIQPVDATVSASVAAGVR